MRIRLMLACMALAVPLPVVRGQVPDSRTLPREVTDEVARIYNAPATLRVSGTYLVEGAREVTGDIAALGGLLTVAGHVTGRVVGINADVRLMPGARLDGGLLVVGGEVAGQDSATIGGDVRTYRASLDYTLDGERLVVRRGDDESTPWWRRRDRWRRGAWSELRLVSAKTYNRVEGLPVHVGTRGGKDFGWGRLLVDGYGIIRSADGFEWKSENLGHTASLALQLGRQRGVRVGGRLFNEVDNVESWQLGDNEVGLASFFLHRDFRDYFNRHGSALTASIFGRRDLDASLSYSDERWSARATRDPWTVFRNSEPWRENPQMDEGTFHVVTSNIRYDTRNDASHPWSGWLVNGTYEYSTGTIARYAPTTPGVRALNVDGKTSYDRILLDVRRYNRIAPDAQLNFRIVAGGWLSGDDLPLQRRFSLGGPGTMPGFDFRNERSGTDVFQCNTTPIPGAPAPAGTPAQCERFALGQFEFRNDLHIDPFGLFDEDRAWRRAGWGRVTQWVLFGDVGRGWLVGQRDGGTLTYGKWATPSLGSFKADVGIGLVLDEVGVYMSKALVRDGGALNFTVRLRPRF